MSAEVTRYPLPGLWQRIWLHVYDVVALGDATRCRGGAVGAARLCRFLGAVAALGFDLGLIVGLEKDAVERFFLELHPGVGVPIQLTRVALATATGAHVLTFPVSIGWTEIIVLLRKVVLEILFGANRQAIHDRVNAGNSARDDDGLVGLVRRVHPARELDDAFVESADVDRALAEYRIVAESFEDALFELFRWIQRALVIVIVVRVIGLVVAVVILIRRAGSSAAEPLANPVGQP